MAYTTLPNTSLRSPTSYGEDDLYDIHEYNIDRMNDTLLRLVQMADVFIGNLEDKDILVWSSSRQKFEAVDCPQPHRLLLVTTTSTTTTTTITTTTTA